MQRCARCLQCSILARSALFQLLAFSGLEWASSQDVLSQLYVLDLQCVSTVQCILCFLPALALRCVAPARYHQCRHHAPGLQCASRVQYALFLLLALALRCVSPARYHQCRHHAEGAGRESHHRGDASDA